MKYNYKITVEIPREIRTRNSIEMTVDTFVSFIYNRKNKESALRAFGSVGNLKALRKQGLKLSRAEFKQYRDKFMVERI